MYYNVLKKVVDINNILKLIDNYKKCNNKKPDLIMSIETLNDISSHFHRNHTNSLNEKIKIAETALKCKVRVNIYGDIKYGEIQLK